MRCSSPRTASSPPTGSALAVRWACRRRAWFREAGCARMRTTDRPVGRSVANATRRQAEPAEPSERGTARMGKPDPAEQSRSRRERILDAAFTAFATRGYRDTAVDDIAGAAETSKGGIYFHFPTKEAIFRELMQTTADKLVARVERAVALETDPVARAEAAIRTVLGTFAGHRTMARL